MRLLPLVGLFTAVQLLGFTAADVGATDQYAYSDDFSTDKAMTDSYSHSPFVDTLPYVHFTGLLAYYEVSPGNRGLAFAKGFLEGEDARLRYSLPLGESSMRVADGAIEFDAVELMGLSPHLHLHVSYGEVSWSESIDAPGHYEYALSPAGSCGAMDVTLRGGGLLDNLSVTFVYSSCLPAQVDFEPNTLNLKSHGNYVTAYVELPDSYDPVDIDLSTVTLNNTVPAEMSPTSVGDHDNDGITDRMMKFRRSDVIALMDVAGYDPTEITISGELLDGTPFAGTDIIRTKHSGDGGAAASDADGVKVHPPTLGGMPRIAYELFTDGPVTLQIFDAAGRLLGTLEAGYKPAGSHAITWDRRTDEGQIVSPGIYFIRLEQHGWASVQRLLILR